MKNGSIKSTDAIDNKKYRLADGSVINTPVFLIESIKVGDRITEYVWGTDSGPDGSLLLGQSFLEKFKSWSFDNTKRELVLE